MSDELIGNDLKLFYDSAASFTTPTWEEQTSVGDIGFDSANEQVEIPKRIAFKTYKKGRGDWSLSFTLNLDPTNTFCQDIIDAINNGTKIHLAFATGEIAAGGYWHGWFMLSGPIDAALDSPATIECEGKVHYDTGTADAEIPAFTAFV